MASHNSLLIAGGGIGGLAAAYTLAKDGHAVTVLEQSSSFGDIGAGRDDAAGGPIPPGDDGPIFL